MLALALETTRGAPATNPTHYLPLSGSLTPTQERYRPTESRGTVVQQYRSTTVRRGSTWTAEGGADPNYLPLFFNMLIKGGVTTPVTPTGATLARLWSFVPSVTVDDIRAATIWFGDPTTQIWRSSFCMADSLTISADASSTDGVTMQVSGQGRFPTKLTTFSWPPQNVGALLMPGTMQVWIDTGTSAIGTTEITGRVVSANFNLPLNLGYKHLAAGPTADGSFTRIGRGKRQAQSTVVFELMDAVQYDMWSSGATVKMRVRLNGDLIEPGFYSFVEWDIYGDFADLAWGDLEGTNRTIALTVYSQYDTTLGADFAARVQNARTAL